jgi:aspartate 1-decarboxylase
LNGAAARHVHRGDIVIIAAFASMEAEEAKIYQPTAVFVDDKNNVKKVDKYSLITFPKSERQTMAEH